MIKEISMKKIIIAVSFLFCISTIFAKESSELKNKKFYGINQLQSDSFYSVEFKSAEKILFTNIDTSLKEKHYEIWNNEYIPESDSCGRIFLPGIIIIFCKAFYFCT